MTDDFTFCPQCATPLAAHQPAEDGGDKVRLRCPACDFTHWNNPTPVLAAVIEYEGQILLARNAAWPGKMYALITGFMEAGETPQEGIAREIAEETNLTTSALESAGRLRFSAHEPDHHCLPRGVPRRGGKLSPELVDYRLYDLQDVKCWPAGTGYALADFLRSRGHEPVFIEPVWQQSTEPAQALKSAPNARKLIA